MLAPGKCVDCGIPVKHRFPRIARGAESRCLLCRDCFHKQANDVPIVFDFNDTRIEANKSGEASHFYTA